MKTVSQHLPWLADALASLDDDRLRRSRREVRPLGRGLLEVDGKRLFDFSSNDYLGLASEPSVVAAARDALESGVGSGASPLVTGRTPYHAELERTLAAFESEDDAILFPSGYAANAGTIAALVDRDDVVFCERSNHSCLVDGCRLSGATFRVFRSDRLDELERHLSSAAGHRRRWIVTDGVFSMDGTLAPLADLCDIAERFDASLVVDEAHGTGVLGEHGRGACEAAGVAERVAVRTGTLSKAVGALGGFVAGPRDLTEYLWNHARTQMFSTALPPAVCAAATAAIRIIEAEPERRTHLATLSTRLRERMSAARFAIGSPSPGSPTRERGTRAGGFPSLTRRATSANVVGTAHPTAIPIIPVILGEPSRVIDAGAELERRGFAVGVIRPPTVPRGTSRLRVSLSAVHSIETVDRLADAIIEVCQP